MLRVAVCMYLRTAGFMVIEASNADDAVRVVESIRPLHLVFSDVNMPGSMDGNALARWILQRHPSIRVLLTSARGDRPEGPIRYVDKPYAFEGLVQTIRALLEQE
jgi:DNA-binding NtrC family response regulator